RTAEASPFSTPQAAPVLKRMQATVLGVHTFGRAMSWKHLIRAANWRRRNRRCDGRGRRWQSEALERRLLLCTAPQPPEFAVHTTPHPTLLEQAGMSFAPHQ